MDEERKREVDEERKQRKMEDRKAANRLSAKLSRQREKDKLKALEQKVESLTKEIESVCKENVQLKLKLLKSQLFAEGSNISEDAGPEIANSNDEDNFWLESGKDFDDLLKTM